MAKDATDEWTSREWIDIDSMREILGLRFLTKKYSSLGYVKNGSDVLEAFAEFCRGREQVVCGVKALRLVWFDRTNRGLLALIAILESGHFNDLQKLAVDVTSLDDFQVAGQKLCHLLGSGRLNDLQSLELYGRAFGGEGVEALAKSLQSSHPSKLEVLHLRRCLKDDEAGQRAVKVLADTIASGHLSSLLTLDLSDNYLGAEGAESLRKSLCSGLLNQLESLDLSNNELGDAGVESLAEAFVSGYLDSLRTLRLFGNSIGAEGVESLGKSFCSAHLTQLECLALWNNKFGDAGVKSLAEAFASGRLGTLQTLDLSRNAIGTEGAESLGKSFGSGHLNTLRTLELGGNDLKDAGVKFLVASFHSGNFNKLETLSLRDCRVMNVGAKALAQWFQSDNCGKLRKLDLSNNCIEGVGLVALVESFKSGRLRDLKAVDLRAGEREYTDGDLIDIARSLGTGSLGSLEGLSLFHRSNLSSEVKRTFVNSYQKNPYLVAHVSREFDTLRNRNEARVARLKKLQDEEEVSGEHGKLFLCGNPGVGKTTLRTTLTKGRATFRTSLRQGMGGPVFESPKQKDREPTRGIEVSNLHSKGSTVGVRPVTLALWDMAGQHDYEVLHSAFLPDLNLAGGQATFFAIVCNANNGGNTPETARHNLVYWLRFISSNSVEGIDVRHRRKVFVILNCFGGDTSGHEKNTWASFLADCRATFGSLLNLYEEPIILDVRNKNAVKPFKNLLLKDARDMLENRKMPQICHTLQEYCREWAKENEKYPVLQWGEYLLTVGKRLWEEEKLRAATEYLHESGHLILFKRHADSGASGSEVVGDPKSTGTQQTFVIMDPQWFCQKVVGNILLPNHMVKENEEALRELRRANSQKLPISAFKKFIFSKSGVPQDKIDEVVVLLSCIGLCYQLPGREDDIFIPALIEGNEEPGWSKGSCNREFDNGDMSDRVWVMGFALLVQNLDATLLPISVLRRLQVNLALDDDIGRRPDCEYSAGKSCIKFKWKHMDVLVEYPMDPTTFESKQDRIDVVVKPLVGDSDPLTRKRQISLAQQIMVKILDITTEYCPGLTLDQRIIKPWSMSEGWTQALDRNVQISVHHLKHRMEVNGELQGMEWTMGNELVKEEDILPEEDLVGFRNLIATKLIHTKEAVEEYGLQDCDSVEPVHVSNVEEYGLQDSESVEPVHVSDEDSKQPVVSNKEWPSQGPKGPDAVVLFEGLRLIFDSQERGFREVMDSQQRGFRETQKMLEDVKKSIEVISTQQRSLNFQIQNLERFSVQEKERAIPRFAYLTEKDQQKWWIKVTEKVAETKYLHFLCEAPIGKEIFHEVDGQEGIDVRKIKDWAKTLVPVLEWTFKIGFVAAKIAGNAVLPGLGLLLDSAALLSSFPMGIEMAQGIGDLSKYLDETLGAALDHDGSFSYSLGEDSSTGSRTSNWVRGRERQLRGDARSAVLVLLNNMKPAEMKRRVGLRKVWLDVKGHGQGHIVWICEQCFRKYGSKAHEI